MRLRGTDCHNQFGRDYSVADGMFLSKERILPGCRQAELQRSKGLVPVWRMVRGGATGACVKPVSGLLHRCSRSGHLPCTVPGPLFCSAVTLVCRHCGMVALKLGLHLHVSEELQVARKLRIGGP